MDMDGKEKASLAYDGECFVCEALADNISHEFHIDAIPVQKLYRKYNLEHDAYLIIGDVKYRGYSWIIPYISKGGFKRLFTSLLMASYPITVKYKFIKRLGSHPIRYLGRGKIPLKVATLFLSVYILRWLFKIWLKIWGLRVKHPI